MKPPHSANESSPPRIHPQWFYIGIGLLSAAASLSVGIWALLSGFWQGGGGLLLLVWFLALTHRSVFYQERVTFFGLHQALWRHLLALPVSTYATFRPIQRRAIGGSLETIRGFWYSVLFDGGFAALLLLVNLVGAWLFLPHIGTRLLVWLAGWLVLQGVLLHLTTGQQRRRHNAKLNATHAAHQMIVGIQTLPVQQVPTWAEHHARTPPPDHYPLGRRAALFGLIWPALAAESLVAWGVLAQIFWAATRLDMLARQSGVWIAHALTLRQLTHEAPLPAPDRGPSWPSDTLLAVADVTLRYHAGGPPILEGLHFQLKQGECVALVGEAGCGKSTLLDLLLGFEQPERGRVQFGDIRRDEIGYVLQDSQLSGGSLKNNLLGNHNLPLEAAWQAARLACIDDLIHDLKMGMMTIIDENGGVFSWGQQQRLLLARALVHGPRLLLLDEAMNAIDEATRQRIHAHLNAANITRLMVVYRANEMQAADRILLMHKGRIIAQGGYDVLYQEQAIFRQLVAGPPDEHTPRAAGSS